MKKIYRIFSLFLISATSVNAQDFHLSQYDMAVQYLNPALTGVLNQGKEDVNFRVNANYRNQWRALNGTPFTTMSFGADLPVERFGFGVFLHSNRTGEGNLNTFNLLLSGSYQVMSSTEEHSLTTGLQIGLLNKTFNQSSFLFDNQYTGNGFDASLPNGEFLDKRSLWRFDANWGAHYSYMVTDAPVKPFGGLAVAHVTRPNESFTAKSKLPMRFTFHGGCDVVVNEQIDLTPTLLFMRQAKAQEINLGLMGIYKLDGSDYAPMAGIGYRAKDAVIIHLGVKQKSNIFRISYDINTSGLKTYTGGRGALEFGVVYMAKQNKVTSLKFL